MPFGRCCRGRIRKRNGACFFILTGIWIPITSRIFRTKKDLKEMLETVAVSSNEEDIIDEALHLLEGYTDPPYPILAAYLGNLSEKHKPKALYLVQEAE